MIMVSVKQNVIAMETHICVFGSLKPYMFSENAFVYEN